MSRIRDTYIMSSQVPILLLKEGSTETKEKDAQRNNITGAKLVAGMAKSSLDPRGMDKILVDTLGSVTIILKILLKILLTTDLKMIKLQFLKV